MKRIISLWFPKLSTDRLARSDKGWSARPAATTAWRENCPRLAALNPHARAIGLRVNMRLADAHTLEKDLLTKEAEPDADRQLIEQIASWCDRYTPWVAVDPLGAALADPEATLTCSAGGYGGDAGLLLDVSGCGHLHGPQGDKGEKGERALMADLVLRLSRNDFTCRAAMADTAGAAWALARYGEKQADLYCPHNGQRDALASLPVDGLRLDPPTLETFLRLGLRRIGDLYSLPRAPLSRRFGDLPLRRLDQALGRVDEPIEPRRPPPAFRSRLSFAEPIGRAEDIAAGTDRLLETLCRQLEQASLGARKLELAIYRVDGSVDRTAIGTSRPNREAPKLSKLFGEKLDGLDPGFGIELMILAAAEVEEWTGAQDSLPETGTPARSSWNEDGTLDLADRLALRLGAENVVRLLPHDSHLPGCVQMPVPFTTAVPEGAWARLASMKGARPIRLLPKPEEVKVMAMMPDDPPRQFQWRQHAHRLVHIEGPERIADEWWRPRRPGAEQKPANIIPPVRDYYRVEDKDGVRFWLFRDGMLNTAKWYLHGFCA